MFAIGVAEADDLIGFPIDVRLVVIAFLNGLGGGYQLSDVDRGRLSLLLQVVSQVLELVGLVLGHLYSEVELVNFFI